jgi:hypothetical protein
MRVSQRPDPTSNMTLTAASSEVLLDVRDGRVPRQSNRVVPQSAIVVQLPRGRIETGVERKSLLDFRFVAPGGARGVE